MRLAGYRNIVVLTGAGISRSAGLATYRGPGGLWADPTLAELAHATGMVSHRREACDMFWKFRRAIREAKPTPAHRALAAFEAALPAGADFLLVTQNVDGLHQLAGSTRVCEYHGSLARWCCACGFASGPADEPSAPVHCGDEPMRPDVVLFGEMIPVDAEHAVKRAMRNCDLFVAIGTSGTVAPASSFVRWARLNQARTVLLNLEPIEGDDFTDVDTGGADDLVPRWFAL
ncbi:MAG: NAD-dependent deacylase [Deltaproteobacteria bacterium]|nr:NAD-dependent deacylase [Deltaproteobacteria bacterium]